MVQNWYVLRFDSVAGYVIEYILAVIGGLTLLCVMFMCIYVFSRPGEPLIPHWEDTLPDWTDKDNLS